MACVTGTPLGLVDLNFVGLGVMWFGYAPGFGYVLGFDCLW